MIEVLLIVTGALSIVTLNWLDALGERPSGFASGFAVAFVFCALLAALVKGLIAAVVNYQRAGFKAFVLQQMVPSAMKLLIFLVFLFSYTSRALLSVPYPLHSFNALYTAKITSCSTANETLDLLAQPDMQLACRNDPLCGFSTWQYACTAVMLAPSALAIESYQFIVSANSGLLWLAWVLFIGGGRIKSENTGLKARVDWSYVSSKPHVVLFLLIAMINTLLSTYGLAETCAAVTLMLTPPVYFENASLRAGPSCTGSCALSVRCSPFCGHATIQTANVSPLPPTTTGLLRVGCLMDRRAIVLQLRYAQEVLFNRSHQRAAHRWQTCGRYHSGGQPRQNHHQARTRGKTCAKLK